MNTPVVTAGPHPYLDRMTVVCWHPVAEDGTLGDPVLKAHYRGAYLHVDHVDDVPPEWVEQAKAAAAELADQRDADMSHWATRDANH